MPSPNVITWPAASTTAVAASQNTAGAGNLILNGTLSQNPANPAGLSLQPSVSFGSVSRTVSYTSSNNLSGVSITTTGTYQGAAQTDVLAAGPNNNTVYTTHLFDTVTSIHVSGAVTAMSAGSGTTGNTIWVPFDYYRVPCHFSAQVVVGGTINYTFQTTMDDVTTIATPTVQAGLVIPNPGNADAYQTVMSSATSSAFGYFSYPVRYWNVIVNSSTVASGTLTVSAIQQGIR